MSATPLSLEHLLRRPDASPAGPAPGLLVLLHGYGSNEHAVFTLRAAAADRVVVAPRGPLVPERGGAAWYPLTGSVARHAPDPAAVQEAIDRVAVFVAEATAAYGTDARRTVVAGFSQGAALAVALLLARPELVAGVAALSGRLLASSAADPPAAELVRGRAVLVTHGLADAVLPVTSGRSLRAFLLTLPVRLTYREHGGGHRVGPDARAALAAWLAAPDGPDASPGP